MITNNSRGFNKKLEKFLINDLDKLLPVAGILYLTKQEDISVIIDSIIVRETLSHDYKKTYTYSLDLRVSNYYINNLKGYMGKPIKLEIDKFTILISVIKICNVIGKKHTKSLTCDITGI